MSELQLSLFSGSIAQKELPTELPDFLALHKNVALMAGAGAGKTHNLISMCLCLLGGARGRQPVEPASLVVVTFTE